MKIAQITWISFLNFGTSLQALALQRVLAQNGHNAFVVDDTHITKIRDYWGVSGLLRRICKPHIWRVIKRYRRFANQYMDIDRKWLSVEDLSARYDAFVCGSDQIWSPLLPAQNNGFYFAWQMRGVKVAYAPSLGAASISEEYCELIRPWLNDFKALSCREDTGAKILSEITGREVETVLDPTLLLTGEEWREIFKLNRTDGPDMANKPNELYNSDNSNKSYKAYVLGYFLTYNEAYLKFARGVADKMGVNLAIFAIDKRMRRYADMWIDAGPEEFVKAIAGCEGLITDSFHGTIFGLHFHRPLLTVQRFRATSKNNQNSRIENLFNILGITDNFLNEEDLTDETGLRTYDYNELERRLGVERQRSLNYLRDALC